MTPIDGLRMKDRRPSPQPSPEIGRGGEDGARSGLVKVRVKTLGKLNAAFIAVGLMVLLAACGPSDSDADSSAPEASGPAQVTEEITASSTDGVLFDIRLSGSVHDSDGDGSFRDEIEVLSPGSVEFQGHFPGPGGDLVIASCFASECQTGERSATFSVRYWKAAE